MTHKDDCDDDGDTADGACGIIADGHHNFQSATGFLASTWLCETIGDGAMKQNAAGSER